jgi:hydroxypyruvate reductase
MSAESSETEHMRNDALVIFREALKAVEPEKAVQHHLRVSGGSLWLDGKGFDLGRFRKILVVGAGKAAAPMARALEHLLGDRITDGAVVVKEGHGLALERVRVYEGGHPVPDENGVRGTREVMSLVRSAGEADLVVCLISGGGSALLVAPREGLSLADKQAVTRALLACGADIHEINTVRKHLSRVKGGQLARLAAPATLISLILSDVVGDDLDVIASGPTVPDSSTFEDAAAILGKHVVLERVAPSVGIAIQDGVDGRIEDTPASGDPLFDRCHWSLVGTNLQALEAAAAKAAQLGFRPLILSSKVEGEAREVAKFYAGIAREIQSSGNPLEAPACILCGGETTVTLQGGGKGGRNQELALATALRLAGTSNIVFLSGGTDGTDGPTEAAGALADGDTVGRALSRGLDPDDSLRRNDSYRFFRQLNDLIVTGPTRTNVMDVYMFLVRHPRKG